ncbi:MAG: nrtA, partial [Phycisphaerales bacterium]|nr:nrtA [Phycisphaerales bacterium]
ASTRPQAGRSAARRGSAAAAVRPELTIGFLPLTDSAPLIAACERELFAKHGLQVRLQKFPSWDAVTDALCAGTIDAAHMLASIPVAVAAGMMGHRRAPLVVPWILNRNGQGITLSRDLAAKVGADPATLAVEARRARASGPPMTFASTHRFGTHELWLRYWLAAGGIDPDADVSMTVTPPPLLLAGLRQGEVCGFCVGEPWNAKAVADGVGYTAVASQDVWADHPEKALAFTESFAADRPDVVGKVLAAVGDASAWLDDPANRPEAAALIARQAYLNVRPEEILPRLGGHYDMGDGRTKEYPLHPMRFSAGNVNYPQQKHAMWFLTQFRRWGMVRGTPDYAAVAARVFRGDLYEAFAKSAGLGEGGASERPETLVDGVTFDPADPEGYATGFAIGHPSEAEPVDVADEVAVAVG